jgi:hypothetical protein
MSALCTSPELQVRARLDKPTVKRLVDAYAGSSATVPPLEIGLVEGKVYVLDGHHRVAALRNLGRSHVDAVVAPMSWAQARERAAMANLAHGLNLKPRERRLAHRRIVAAYLAQKRHLVGRWGASKSFRDIAADLGGQLSYSTIRRIILRYHPRLAAKYWSAEEPYGGGPTEEEPGVKTLAQVQELIAEAEALMKGLRNSRQRGVAIARLEGVVERVKEEAPFELAEADDTSDLDF